MTALLESQESKNRRSREKQLPSPPSQRLTLREDQLDKGQVPPCLFAPLQRWLFLQTEG